MSSHAMISPSKTFGQLYAENYDEFYRSFDYARAYVMYKRGLAVGCGNVDWNVIDTVIDVGCGTGEFTRRLAADGHHVVGVDPSEHMLAVARAKIAALPDVVERVAFINKAAADFSLVTPADAAFMPGAVLGYSASNDQALATLMNVGRNLKRGAVLVLDVWNANAVLTQRPGRSANVTAGLTRAADSKLDFRHSICEVSYGLWRDNATLAVEKHHMRYFMPTELDLLLTASGFQTVTITPFPDFDALLSDKHWHMMAVAVNK